MTARYKRGIIPHRMNDPRPEGHMASHIGRRKLLATLGGAAARRRGRWRHMRSKACLYGTVEEGSNDEAARYSRWRGSSGYRRHLKFSATRNRTGHPTAENGDRLARRVAGASVQRDSFG